MENFVEYIVANKYLQAVAIISGIFPSIYYIFFRLPNSINEIKLESIKNSKIINMKGHLSQRFFVRRDSQDVILMIFRLHLYIVTLLRHFFAFAFFSLVAYISISVINLINLSLFIEMPLKILMILPPVYRFISIVGTVMNQQYYANLGIRIMARKGDYPQRKRFLFPWQN